MSAVQYCHQKRIVHRDLKVSLAPSQGAVHVCAAIHAAVTQEAWIDCCMCDEISPIVIDSFNPLTVKTIKNENDFIRSILHHS